MLAREVWTVILTHWGKAGWIPKMDDDVVSWRSSKEEQGLLTRDMRTVVMLVLWSIWTHWYGR